MGKYKLFAYDLDGTLLATDKNLPEENRRALAEAYKKGNILVPATGRIYLGISELIRNMGVSRYYICCNGAVVLDAETGETIYSADLPLEDALKISDHICSQFDAAWGCYQDGHGFMSSKDRDNLAHFFEDKFMLGYILSAHSGVPDFRGMLIRKGRGMHKCSFYFADKAERQYCLETLPKLFPHIKFTSSVPNNIECNSFQADKGLALNALCSFLGIPEASSVAFGDGTNDIAMLKAAGLGVAMANAPDEVKASADITADTNDNAGVGKMILSLIEA